MGHIAKYTEKLILKNNKIYRVITAHWKQFNMAVFKQELESEDQYIRNIEIYSCSPWLFLAPNEPYKYTSQLVGTEKWFKCACYCGLGGESEQTKEDLIKLFENTQYKEFNYTLKALIKDNEITSLLYIFNVLKAWNKNKKVELLVKAGLTDLAMNGSFMKLKEATQKEIIKLCLSKKAPSYATLNDLLIMVKTGCDYSLCKWGGDPNLQNYLLEQNEYLDYYKDYIKMAKALHKNLNDNYWKYPKNLVEAHNKCMDQYNNVLEAKKLLKLKKENQEVCEKIEKVAKKLSKKLNKQIDGYDVCIASSLEDIQKQATTLSQCLMSCGYYKQYANKNCILVFIKQGEKRLATAEIKYDNKNPLGQFYADEKDRKKCIPNSKLKNVLNKWINNTYLTSGLATA